MVKNSAGTVVVIGAGIVGVAAALWLRRLGRDVVLVDRAAPGHGASYGNAGILARCSIVPITTPGLALSGPMMLLDRWSPLFLRWSRLPRLAPWLLHYLSHANDKDTQRITRALHLLVDDSLVQHQALAKGTPAARWIKECRYVHAYANRAAFLKDSYVWELRRDAGIVPEVVSGAAVAEVEPNLDPDDTGLLAILDNHAYIGSPQAYVQDLASAFEQEGGQIVRSAVRDFRLVDGKVATVIAEDGQCWDCSQVVVAAGAWSGRLLSRLGVSVPLQSERGYHVLFKNPSIQLQRPIMVASSRFAVTPMADGLRCAGVVEFADLKLGPSRSPLEFLHRVIKRIFPGLTYSGTEEWLGHRPVTVDSLPLIGEIGASGVYTAFGHHHVGLTGGPKTGRIIADLIMGRPPELADLSPYHPERFRPQ